MMRAVYTVQVKRHSTGETADAHGNFPDVYSDPEDVAVFGIAPRFSNEPDPARTAVVEGLTLLAPADVSIGPHDLVVVDGEDWQAEGDTADWTRGPFSWSPGVAINLKRAKG